MSDAEPMRRTKLPRVSIPLPWFQFSLAKLMLVVTVVAIGLTLAVTIGGFIGAMFSALVWCVLPTPLIICAIYGRGDVQAFSIGALVPWLSLMTMGVPSASAYLPASIWLLILSGVCGTVAAATRRWVVKYGRD